MSVLSVISQNMTNDQLMIRLHVDDLNTKSQLIVYESQEAILYKDGRALDLFGPGRHTINTENLPILKKFVGSLFGGRTPFPCDIYFINKVSVLDFRWGTDSPVEITDPVHTLLVGVRANGQTGIRITDSRRFAVKVSGMLSEFTAETLKPIIKGQMMAPIKEAIASAIIEKGVSVLEITPHLSEIAEVIQTKLNAKIADLGIQVDHFSLNGILASDGDLDALKKSREEMLTGVNQAKMEAKKIEILSEARARARMVEGYSYHDERRFDILEGAAKNESSSGGFINMGVGMGVGMGVSREVSKMTDAMTNPVQSPAPSSAVCAGCGAPLDANAKFCSNCGQPRPTAKFCPECGTQVTPGSKFCMNCGTKLQ